MKFKGMLCDSLARYCVHGCARTNTNCAVLQGAVSMSCHAMISVNNACD